jgi:hypothetical protein
MKATLGSGIEQMTIIESPQEEEKDFEEDY